MAEQQMPTGPFEHPIPIERNDQVTIIIISTLSIFVPAVFIGLRLYAKSLTSRKLDKSDYCILVALVSPPPPRRGEDGPHLTRLALAGVQLGSQHRQPAHVSQGRLWLPHV